jgi:polysaccharide pyruvyl transferase WcaK-like protein
MSARAPRVGVFGLLGSGNLGNDASVDSIMRYLQAEHPDAVVDAMCTGWERIRDRYGIETVPFQWQPRRDRPWLAGPGLKVLGKAVDLVRTAAWVRRHDVVIIPGMGIMDATLPINPWGFPLMLFALTWFGRRSGTKVAMVSVGATPARQLATRWLFTTAARLVSYRTFRDADSREVLRRQGLDTSADKVYPDLVFAIPVDREMPVDPGTVGLGVMAYHGSNEDRGRAGEISTSYLAAVQGLARWLVDNGRSVRLFVGDEADQAVVDAILADLRAYRPDLGPARVVGDPISTYPELLRRLGPAATVVATRFHNVVFSLKLGKPTISLGYSPKNDSLMRDVGLSDYRQPARSIDLELLKAQFADIEKRRDEIVPVLDTVVAERSGASRAQFAELSATLFGAAAPVSPRRRERPSLVRRRAADRRS